MQDLIGVNREERRGSVKENGKQVETTGPEDDFLAPDEFNAGQ